MMNKYISAVLLGIVMLTSAAAQDARDILDRADRSFELDRVYSESTLTVYKNGKPQAPQRMIGYTLDDPAGEARSLTVFREPARVAGTAYLMLGDDLWVRFASTGRVRKLSSSAKKNSAAGSDFSYADMGEGGNSFSLDYSAVLDGSDRIGGTECYRLVLTPANRNAVYEKMVVWVSRDESLYLKIEYYDRGAPVKYMTLENFNDVGGVPYPEKITMTSLVKRSESVMETQLIEHDSDRVEERFFTTSYLDTIR